MMISGKRQGHSKNQLRIIGGQWRGRKLNFADIDGLRPTPDRVRETLFNWLAPTIVGSQCLDVFAGSGALGLEALSRGAKQVDFIDTAPIATRHIQSNLSLLDGNGHVHQASAENWLTSCQQRYDVIFLDPPFHKDLLPACIELIAQRALIHDQGWIYLEMADDEALPTTPSNWHLHRDNRAGKVRFYLFSVQ